MLRRLLLVAALALTAAGCQDAPASNSASDTDPTTGGFWSTAPQTDAQRLEMLRRARNIDPCALLPNQKLREVGAVVSVDNTQPSTCKAIIGSAEPGKGTTLVWHVVAPPTSIPWEDRDATIERVGNVTVSLLDDRKVMTNEQVREQGHHTCYAEARFPATAEFWLDVQSPIGGDPCAVARSLVRTALTEWRIEPPHGTSPVTARSILTGHDPCAVAPGLGVTVPAGEQQLHKCAFTYHGNYVVINYEYHDGDPAGPGEPAFTVGPRPVHQVAAAAGDTRVYSAPVGPPLRPAVTGQALPTRIPVVSAVGKPDAVEEVMRRLLPMLP
ncbi:hypothetical protein [Nocardia sp. NPDC050793]|uniref:hypothetical protein n=1 Tax=Nocardia sp. NPDC050793 TaxID=3155159 RepID=UPI0033DAAD44